MTKQRGEFMTPAVLNKRWRIQPIEGLGTQEFTVMHGRVIVRTVPHAKWNGRTKEKELGFLVSSEVIPKQHRFGD